VKIFITYDADIESGLDQMTYGMTNAFSEYVAGAIQPVEHAWPYVRNPMDKEIPLGIKV
jgi:hypothetical protein